jgi:rhodanese-related sulfurtransferase
MKSGSAIRRWGLAGSLTVSAALIVALVLEAFSPGTLTQAHKQISWQVINVTLHQKYADVRAIQTQALADWLADPARVQPLLLDVREPAEYALSHLPGAKNVNLAKLDVLPPDKASPIVVYCSVGLRSADAARHLKALGYSNVFNLEGSIFQWANEDRALEGGSRVHPYDAQWGRLLRSDKRAAVLDGTR